MCKRIGIPLACLILTLAPSFPALASGDEPNPVGRPKKFTQGKRAMYGVWNDDGIWRLRMTGKKDVKVIFTGVIRAQGDRLIGEWQGLEKADKAKNADWIFPHTDGKGFDFRFVVFGKTDGVNFKVGPKAESVMFKLLVDGDDDPKKILIGTEGKYPDKGDFTLPALPKK